MAAHPIEAEKHLPTEDSSQNSVPMAEISVPKEAATEIDKPEAADEIVEDYPQGARLAVIVISLMLGMFLVALDNVSNTLSDSHSD